MRSLMTKASPTVTGKANAWPMNRLKPNRDTEVHECDIDRGHETIAEDKGDQPGQLRVAEDKATRREEIEECAPSGREGTIAFRCDWEMARRARERRP